MPAEAATTYDYEWLVENGAVVGCIETSEVKLSDDPVCGQLPFTPLACIKYTEKEKIYDPENCATRIRTAFNWTDERAELCGEFALVEKNGERSKFFLRTVEKSLCSHTWVAPAEKEGQCYFREAGRFDFHPLSNLGIGKLVPEIMKLAKDQTVPAEIYKKYGSKEIAATLVYKLGLEGKESTERVTAEPFDYLENSELQIAFNMADLPGILEKGFLNQHQLKKSAGCLCPTGRKRVENALIGRKLVEPEKEGAVLDPLNMVRPKYAFFVPTAKEEDEAKMNITMAPMYGEVLAVLSPQVKDRTTFTIEDSLGGSNELNHPWRHTLKASNRLVQGHTESFPRYWEAQILGELKVQSDVSYYLWGCFPSEVSSRYPDDKLAQLKATGKPVYECKADHAAGTIQRAVTFHRGKQL